MISESLLLQQRACVSEWEDNILFDVDDPDFAGSITPTATAVVAIGGNRNRHESAAMLGAMILQKVPSTMSLADMQKPSYLSMSALSIHSSLSDLAASHSPFDQSVADNNAVLTIEELRAHMGSCFTCGVSWTDDHVSLDCSECGGYSSQRPCPLCDGACGELWKRDFSMSHACSKARWIGHCPAHSSVTDSPLFTVLPPAVAAAVVQHRQNAAAAAAAAVAASAASASAASASSCASSVASATSLQQKQQQTCGASQFLAHDLCVRLERLSASAQT